MSTGLATELVSELEKLGTEDRAVNEKRYLKSPPEFHHFGVTVPSIRKATKAFARSHKEIDHDHLVALVNELWELQIHETCMAAIELLNFNSSDLTADDAGQIERLIDSSHTWAYVDNLSATTMGSLVARYPELNATLDRWSTHSNFWLRRAAMLSLLGPLRAGGGDFEQFSRYAEPMLQEKEFFIRKAIGWILRETSKKRPELVYKWLADHTSSS
jgi:3-methyladenine DNA glycosylase AlkD